MFESGEAVLKPDGEAVLLKVAGVLKQHPTLMVHVVGHTDNVPIRASARSRFASNWELSTARALAAVRFLSESGGVDPRRLGAVGYGEYHPIADNTTEKGRAKNRRIAITVVSDEVVGADAALAPVMTTVSSNAVPSAAPTNALASTNAAPPPVNPPSKEPADEDAAPSE
jgi:chemotaxis protein MotB